MPNYVGNQLTIMGDSKDLNDFIQENMNKEENLPIDLNTSVPVPKRVKSKRMDKWRDKNWGASYLTDFSNESHWDIESTTNTRSISFSSPWIAPYPWFFTVIKKYSSINFKLESAELGNEVYTIIHAEKGVVTSCENKSEELSTIIEMYEIIFNEEYERDEENAALNTKIRLLQETKHGDMVRFLDNEGLLFETEED